uniref:Uncharacterized protein n=1 Tax=Arion vulgaris TaxID=1028688 RepID=A0A0B6Y1T0_9EUPU
MLVGTCDGSNVGIVPCESDDKDEDSDDEDCKEDDDCTDDDDCSDDDDDDDDMRESVGGGGLTTEYIKG